MMNFKNYVFKTVGTLRRKHRGMEKEATTPILLGLGMGGQEMFMVFVRKALALDCLVFCEHLWTPHCW